MKALELRELTKISRVDNIRKQLKVREQAGFDDAELFINHPEVISKLEADGFKVHHIGGGKYTISWNTNETN